MRGMFPSLHATSLDSLHSVPVSLALGSPGLDPGLQVCLTSAEQRGGVTSPDLLAVLCLMQPRRSLAAFGTRAHCCLVVNLVPTRTPRAFSAKLFRSWSAPSMYWCMDLFLPRCRTLHFPSLNFMRFLSAHSSSLLRSLGMAAQPSGVSATPRSLVSSAYFLRVHSVTTSRSVMKMLNSMRSGINCWGTPLVTGLQLDFMLLITTHWAWQCSSPPHLWKFYFLASSVEMWETVLKVLLKSR